MGHGKIIDSMIQDGLWDVYNDMHMGNCAELCARERNYSREAQDAVAIKSYTLAQHAQKRVIQKEIVPVEIPQKKGEIVLVKEDEEPGRARFEKFLLCVLHLKKKVPLPQPMLLKSATGLQHCWLQI
jgi:acetyl-CoA C-acetyltransferase